MLKGAFFILLIFFMTGCDLPGAGRPSVLVIAVEGLDSESIQCSEDVAAVDDMDGFHQFCREAVRFSHAFTTSTMSQASLASVLTGLYPLEHGVRHNGSHYLSETFLTSSEAAFAKGYRTALFSGGAPIWRKSGLDQGFEFFEDHFEINFQKLYRPVAQNFELFLRWQAEEVGGRSFFSVVYLPDLQFERSPTQDQFGQERALSRESQVNEVSESFQLLVDQLKKRKRWDNTHVVLVGLNGRSERYREEELAMLNLHGENTQIGLFWKPARRNNEVGSEWSIDANVSLADVGVTLFDILGVPNEKSDLDGFEKVSLRGVLARPQVTWNKDRGILTESGWSDWRREGGIRYAFRQNHVLFLHDKSPRIYNTLVDRFEMQPISPNDPSVTRVVQDAQRAFQLLRIKSWDELPVSLVEKLRFARDWMVDSPEATDLDARIGVLIGRRKWDSQLQGWLARHAVERKNWVLLEGLAEESGELFWDYLAKERLGQKVTLPQGRCLDLLNSKTISTERSCRDEEFIALVKARRANDQERERSLNDFLKIYFQAELEERISRFNYQTGLRWETNLEHPGAPRFAQLALELDDFRKLKSAVDRERQRRSVKMK